MSKIIEYVHLDAIDGKPSDQYPARHGGVNPVEITRVIEHRQERDYNENYPGGFDFTVFIGETDAEDISVPGVIRELGEDEVSELLDKHRALKIQELNDGYTAQISVLEVDYPASERESWHVQVEEARRLKQGDTDTPWIDAAASTRGITREELADLIHGQDSAYRTLHGTITGIRQGARDQIMAATSFADFNQIVPAALWGNDA